MADSTAVGRPEGIALLLRRARFAALACAGLLAAAAAPGAAADTETLKLGGAAQVAGGGFGSAPDSGQLAGRNRVDSVVPAAGSYTVTAPPATATLVVLPPNVAAQDR